MLCGTAWLVVLWHGEGQSSDGFLPSVYFIGTLNAWPLAPISFAPEVSLWNPSAGSYIQIRSWMWHAVVRVNHQPCAPWGPKPAMTFPYGGSASPCVSFSWYLLFFYCVGVCAEETAWQGDGDTRIKGRTTGVCAHLCCCLERYPGLGRRLVCLRLFISEAQSVPAPSELCRWRGACVCVGGSPLLSVWCPWGSGDALPLSARHHSPALFSIRGDAFSRQMSILEKQINKECYGWVSSTTSWL